MKLAEVMKRLEQAGNESTLKTWRRHEVTGPAFGVRFADLYALRKQIKVDHALARELWATGNHDARTLATLIADPEAMTVEEFDAWQAVCDGNYGLNGMVADVGGRSPLARELVERWHGHEGEYRSAAGWHVLGILAAGGTDVDDAYLRPYLAKIRKGIHAAPNRTRYSMNSVLIAIGGYHPELRDEALVIAKAIGKVEVDHGDTSCKTPDAVEYIAKMMARQSKKAAKHTAANGTPAKKTAAKKTAAKKTAAKKTAAKKTAAKKTAAKKA
ncbi:DNA alkylation repair protein [Paraliomyxa miuraensis]|uniref:DNA alkylation repair protein n=1 Tax=Paraliomyxa miuraensis TaxID=376150 RepID=UPI0022510319|nr:DNA alkylation repair protein [Paraliomyxa miuraensis]MCX4242540.1 DNA alkylation repair protein [Paraliomyxa miuraensis]